MKDNREEFPARIRHQIEKKSAYRCSNPMCLKVVIGPSHDFQKVINMGVVSHISAASPRGPRYDPTISTKTRTSEENGLLLCRYCAALVDADDVAYPPALLRQWRHDAYQRALDQMGYPTPSAAESRSRGTVVQLVKVCLSTYQTHGTLSKEANFRSCASILYHLLFEELPREKDYQTQLRLWEQAIHEILSDTLEPVHVRTASHDRSFPRQYRTLMTELNSYGFQPQRDKAYLLDLIEATVRDLFHSGEAFGLRDDQRSQHA